MSKSIKRHKYYDDDMYYESHDYHEEHRSRLKEKRIKAALKSKNVSALYELTEEE